MARQSKKYFLLLGDGQHRVSGQEFHRLIAVGLCLAIEEYLAKPKNGVDVEIRAGKLWLHSPAWIYTSWIAIDQIAPVRGEHYEQDRDDQYCDPRGARRWRGYTEIRTRMLGWKGTFQQLQDHVQQNLHNPSGVSMP